MITAGADLGGQGELGAGNLTTSSSVWAKAAPAGAPEFWDSQDRGFGHQGNDKPSGQGHGAQWGSES